MNTTTQPALTAPASKDATAHSEAAMNHIQQLRTWRETIPNFAVPATMAEAKRLTARASIPPEFVDVATTAITTNPELARPSAAPEVLRDLMDYAEAYTAVADELEVTTQFLRYSIKVAKSKAGTETLATLELAKRLSKRADMAHLAPYVDDMSRALKARARMAKAARAAARFKEAVAKATAGAQPAGPKL
jgi:hypothetical protein